MKIASDADRRHLMVGAAAGAMATVVWAAVEPLMARALGHRFTDVRLLGRFMGPRRAWPALGLGAHMANGALFGIMLAAGGPLGFRRVARWVTVETIATWPLMAVADRVHPDRRAGRWPRLFTSPRVFVQEVIMHAVFAAPLAGFAALIGRGRTR